MQSFFKKLPRYSLRLLLAYLAYIFAGGVLAYLLPRQARNLPQTDSFYGIGRGPDRAVLVEEPQDAFARRVEVIRTAQSTLDVCYHCVKSGETTECFFAELLRAADRGVRVRVLLDGTVGGLSGAFIPVSEDEGMIAAARSGVLTIDKLEAMTCVCSVGLDMIAVPGDTTAETISAIIADEAAVGMVNSKTTAVRIIPVEGKTVGDTVELGGLLGSAPLMPVHDASSADFIARGGRIPAPLQSLKN